MKFTDMFAAQIYAAFSQKFNTMVIFHVQHYTTDGSANIEDFI